MSEHTKEPWGTNGDPYVFAGNKSIAFCDTARNGDDENKSNARRIVACVNACEGLPTELIEKHGVTRSGIAKGINEIEQQRDELLKAADQALTAMEMERVMAEDKDGNYTIEVTPKIILAAIKSLDEAIKKVKNNG